jgi:hypothetical protein
MSEENERKKEQGEGNGREKMSMKSVEFKGDGNNALRFCTDCQLRIPFWLYYIILNYIP